MTLSTNVRGYGEGRYGEWTYGGKPLIPPMGGGTRRPAPIDLTIARDIPMVARGPLITMPARTPHLIPMRPGVVDPNRRIPKVWV